VSLSEAELSSPLALPEARELRTRNKQNKGRGGKVYCIIVGYMVKLCVQYLPSIAERIMVALNTKNCHTAMKLMVEFVEIVFGEMNKIKGR
jgi:hypothetical protein